MFPLVHLGGMPRAPNAFLSPLNRVIVQLASCARIVGSSFKIIISNCKKRKIWISLNSKILEATLLDNLKLIKFFRGSSFFWREIIYMKITGIDIYQLGERAEGSATWAGNSIVLKLTTSDGLVGYGEAVPTLRVQPVIQSLHEVARVYLGKDPLNVEANMHEWHKHDFYLPVSFESTTAVSAFDIACWDIIGKHFGAPIHHLTGGKFRDKVRVYANGWYNDCVTPEQFAEKSCQVYEDGLHRTKV